MSSSSSSQSAEATPALNGTLVLILINATVFFCCLTISMSLGVVPAYVHQTLGFGNVIVGLTVGLQSLATVMTRRYAGQMADMRGAKSALLRGLCAASLAGITMFVTSLLLGMETLQLATLFISRLFLGIGESLLITGALAWAIGRLGAAQSGRVMSWTGAAIFSALAAGVPAGVWLESVGGFQSVTVAICLLPVLAFLVCARVGGVRPLGTASTQLPYSKVIGLVWREGSVLALHGVGFATIGAFIVLYFNAQGWAGAGMALSVFGIAFVMVRLVLGWLPDRRGGVPVAFGSILIEIAGLLLLWQATSPWMAFLGAGLAGCGSSLVFPSMGLEVVKRVPASIRGTCLGTYSAFLDVAYLISGPVTGAIATAFGYGSVYLVSALAACAALGLLVVTARLFSRTAVGAEEECRP
ncbi:putative MFS family arabinose efflux permease [Pseudomonas duriflava]|uniref:Putative MFS family arabinose efflux permease n=1 Tax=Pseudomonas duriflava TaxID=459528 RepID=A0A562QDK4_9PSED|nr:MFS transporter [Pseudomonas duriflava]TWI54814.1 putative MFS family arabinose efflux permease [Pseudomonas duriflava]